MSVQNLEKIVGFGLSLGDKLLAASEQATTLGKISALIPLFEDLSTLLSVDYAQLEVEVKGLSPEDLEALAAYVDKHFPAVGSDVKVKVEAAIAIVIELAKVAEKAVAIWK